MDTTTSFQDRPHTETTGIMQGEIFKQLEETVSTGHTGALDLPKNNAEVIPEGWQLPAWNWALILLRSS